MFLSLVIAPSNPCKLRHQFRWALLLAVVMGTSPAFGDGTPAEATLKIRTQVGEGFTTAQINTVLRLIDRAKQRIDPEYYLSETYLHEAALDTFSQELSQKRRRNRQMIWHQKLLERQSLRKEQIAERKAERERLEQMRAQERNIIRVQRRARLYHHRKQRCLNWRRWNNPRNDRTFSHRTHPSCL